MNLFLGENLINVRGNTLTPMTSSPASISYALKTKGYPTSALMYFSEC